MKYPLYMLPNQHPNQVVIQGKRDTFENILSDFGDGLVNRRVLSPVREQFRQHKSEIIRIRLDKETAGELLRMVSLSY